MIMGRNNVHTKAEREGNKQNWLRKEAIAKGETQTETEAEPEPEGATQRKSTEVAAHAAEMLSWGNVLRAAR